MVYPLPQNNGKVVWKSDTILLLKGKGIMIVRTKKSQILVMHLVANLSWKAVAQRYPVKKVFLEISQNLQENTCARVSFLIKLQAWGLQLY